MGAPRKNAEFDRLSADAAAHYASGRMADAETAYRAALAITPGHPAILHNLGVLDASRGSLDAALEWFGAAIAAEPRYALAYHNRAGVQRAGPKARGDRRFLAGRHARPVALCSHRALGFLSLAHGDRGRALDHFARTHELRRGEDRTGIAAESLDSPIGRSSCMTLSSFATWPGSVATGRASTRWPGPTRRSARIFPWRSPRFPRRSRPALGETYNTAISVRGAPEL